ncbi:hypothetical protein DNTS_020558, partial [Danionella cerebrum]
QKMPNESDEPPKEEKGKIEKRIRSSPPGYISVEELMETATGVTNMALAHEIVMDSAFQIKPFEPEEGSLEKRVKEMMHKAFWDVLESQLNKDPPQFNHAISLVGEIKETLLSLLLPGQSRLRGQVEEALDLSLIQQEAENEALDISKLAHFIIDMMGILCAPCRDEDIRKLREISDIVPLFKSIFGVLDKMKIDMANVEVSSLRPHLLQQSVEYERKKFQEFLEKQPNALDFTKKWLQDTADYVTGVERDGGATCTANSSQLPLTVHNYAYLRLLKWNHDTELFPETLLMDQGRFQEIQRELEQVALVASVLLIVYNSAGEAISGLPGLMERLKKTIRILIAEMHIDSFDEEETFAAIAEKLCLEIRGCLSQHGYSPFSSERENTLKGQIVAAKSADNPIRKVIDSRIQSFLLDFLESSSHRSIPAPPGGLTPIHKELQEIAVKLGRVVTFNKLVYSPFYQKILQDVVIQG